MLTGSSMKGKMWITACVQCLLFCHYYVGASFQPFVVPPPTVSSLNTTAYLGRWYQMYASLIPNSTFERNASCVFADYYVSEKPLAAFALTNGQRVNGPSGKLQTIDGDAFPAKDPGKFKIKFDKDLLEFGDYWVIALGEATAQTNHLYPWAVISVPYRTSLFIIARDVKEFRSKYKKDVLRWVDNQGFNKPHNFPRETYQNEDCQYAPAPSPKQSPIPGKSVPKLNQNKDKKAAKETRSLFEMEMLLRDRFGDVRQMKHQHLRSH